MTILWKRIIRDATLVLSLLGACNISPYVEKTGASAVSDCTTVNDAVCERAGACSSNFDVDSCKTNGAFGGACANATSIRYEGDILDADACAKAITNLGCEAFADLNDIDAPCPKDIDFGG
ncbi:MAG: hypothetical protein JXR83_10880 [Deltaproteobacteria bacterium]|nr:hypothetical protein [Deltaproteobacteria bacterium]